MRYLVTGGAGFIGSNTVDELVRRGHDVVVLDDLSGGKVENLSGANGKIELLRHSVTDLDRLHEACRGVDYVLHLGARTSVPRSVLNPLETNHVNVDGTLNILVAARDAKVKRVVFAGSSAVYGETPTLPKRENMPPAPISPYGLSKLAGEIYGQVFQRCYGLEFVSLRYFNVFGPRQDPASPYSGVLSLFNAAVLRTQRNATQCLRRWRAITRLHLRRKRGRSKSAGVRSETRRGTRHQHWHRLPLHAEPDAGVARENYRPARKGEIRFTA